MDRRNFLVTVVGISPLAAVVLFAKGQGKGKGRGRGKKAKHRDEEYPERRDDEYPEHRDDEYRSRQFHYFRREDYGSVERYYHGPRDLPPGLRKKYYRTGKLPPGWQKKVRPFPPQLVRVLPPPPPGCELGYIDGVAVVYDRKTRIILDSIDLVSAIAGR